MSYKMVGLKALGLSFLAAFGLAAIVAADAQANWLYLEGGVAKELIANELIKASAHQEVSLLFLGGELNGVEIRCATIEGEDLLLIAKSSEAAGKVAFNNCHTFHNGTKAPLCDPSNQPVKAAGKAHLILVEGKNYLLFEPNTGGSFTTFEFDEELCLFLSIEIFGSFTAECGQLNGSGVFVGEDCAIHQVSRLLKQAPNAVSTDKLTYGLSTLSLDGIAKAELAGALAGRSWSGEV